MDSRDQHLRSADFLNAEQYPTLTFVSTGVERVADDRFRLVGNLTILGETRRVEFDVEYLGVVKNLQGGASAGFAARATSAARTGA